MSEFCSSAGSITRATRDINQGKNVSESQRKIFERYFERLDRLATKQLGNFKRVADGQDVAAESLAVLFQKADQSKLEVNNRRELWALLRRIGKCNAINKVNAANAQKQKPKNGTVLTASSVETPSGGHSMNLAELAVDYDDDIEYQLRTAAELIERIDDQRTRTVAAMTLQGYSAREIALAIGKSKRMVERHVNKAIKILESM